LTFFKEGISQEELNELVEMDEDIKKAEEKIEYLSGDPKTVELYKVRESSLHDSINMINGAKEEGINIGEDKKAIKVAENLLEMGLTIEQIATASEISVERVREIKKKMMH
jgi:predicted transposase/invertase (TIGR01784 family)